MGRTGAVVLVVVVALGGCGAKTSFDSPDSAARLRAIQRAGAADDRSSIPKLIEMLDSDDPAVRMMAIGVLEDMTGENMGYDPIAPGYERDEAVDRWERWERTRQGQGDNVPQRTESGTNGGRTSLDRRVEGEPSSGVSRRKVRVFRGGAGGGAVA